MKTFNFEMIEAAAKALYECEARRAGLVSDVLTIVAGAPREDKIEPYSGNEETWRADARAALSAAFEAAGFGSMSFAAVMQERLRQIYVEGWTPEHDDEHADGSLARAAAAYALGRPSVTIHSREGRDNGRPPAFQHTPVKIWPWSLEWWKPKTRRQDLVRAAALLVAEIERMDRADPSHD